VSHLFTEGGEVEREVYKAWHSKVMPGFFVFASGKRAQFNDGVKHFVFPGSF